MPICFNFTIPLSPPNTSSLKKLRQKVLSLLERQLRACGTAEIGSVLGNELVTDPVNGSKVDWTLRIALDFLAQFCDAIVYRAVTSPLPPWPYSAYEFLPRDHNFRSRNKELQHFELL
jgi:hypothetical protein